MFCLPEMEYKWNVLKTFENMTTNLSTGMKLSLNVYYKQSVHKLTLRNFNVKHISGNSRYLTDLKVIPPDHTSHQPGTKQINLMLTSFRSLL